MSAAITDRTTDTPITDAQVWIVKEGGFVNGDHIKGETEVVGAPIARQLERELGHLKRSNDGMFQRLAPSVEYVEGTAVGYGADEIDRLRAEVKSLQGFADLWYFAMDRAPGDFQRIVTTHKPSQWMYEIAKIRRGER